MAKQSVLDMLKRPPAVKPAEPAREQDQGVMEFIKFKIAQGESDIRAEMQKKIDAALAVQDSLRSELESVRRTNSELRSDASEARSEAAKVSKENESLRASIERVRSEAAAMASDKVLGAISSNGSQVSKIMEGMNELKDGIEKMANRPVQVTVPEPKPAPVPAPAVKNLKGYDVKITSRDANGNALTFSAVPKK